MKKEKRESKFIGGHVQEVKQEERNGVQIGIVEGYIATWDVDRGDFFGTKDQFKRGAFVESILEHIQKRRQIRLKDHHGRTVGGFPIEFVKEDERGLFGVGEINLEVQQGREAFMLAKQGVLVDFSIGFSVQEFEMDGDLRTITKAIIWEGSIVDEPMNPAANITQVKSVVAFQDLPLADRDREWDASKAVVRIRDFSNSEDEPSATYKNYFLWYDRENADNFGAYKMPIADVIDGGARAIPRAIFAAAGVMQGARGGVDIPDADRAGVKAHIERYYDKMDIESPFTEDEGMKYYSADDVKAWTERDVEKALREGARFSKNASRTVMSILAKEEVPGNISQESINKTLNEIKSFIDSIKS